MYSTKSVPKISLEDLTRIKKEFQERKIDQKFLAEDFSVATLSVGSESENTNQRKGSILSSSSAPLTGQMKKESTSMSSPVTTDPAPPPPAPPRATEAKSDEKEKQKGRPSIIPMAHVVPAKKPLSETDLSPPVASPAPAVSAPPPPPPPPKPQEKTAIALYDFVPDGAGISLTHGEVVTVLDVNDPAWWLVRNSNGQDGWAPATFLQINQS
jgi:hypothetical protein